MGRFSRAELDDALVHYKKVAANCSDTLEWGPFADLFTEDAVYQEHGYGTFHGREAIRNWIIDVMAPFPQMRFEHQWLAVDEDTDALIFCIMNILDHPTEPGTTFTFPNWTRIVYAGDGLWSSEEDIYNPARDAPGAVSAWVRAGGRFLCKPQIEMQHA